MDAPHGCAEQTISAGYANLIAWRFARAAGVTDPAIEKRALANIRLAVEAVNIFRDEDSGIAYWPKGDSEVAVTAYALSFLIEASKPRSRARRTFGVACRLAPDSSGKRRIVARSHRGHDLRRPWIAPGKHGSSIARRSTKSRTEGLPRRARRAYHHIAQFTDRTDEPYLLANFVLGRTGLWRRSTAKQRRR